MSEISTNWHIRRNCSGQQLMDGCYALGEGLCLGVKHSVMGTLNWFIHPADSLQNLFNVFRHPIETASRVRNEIADRPVAFATTVAASVALGGILPNFGGGAELSNHALHSNHGLNISHSLHAASSSNYHLTNGTINGIELVLGLGLDAQRAMQAERQTSNVNAQSPQRSCSSTFFSSPDIAAEEKSKPKPARVSWGFF